MFKPKQIFNLLAPVVRRLSLVLVFAITFTSVSGIYTYTRTLTPERAFAATSSNLNFQARLLTASGNTVPDGYYNIQFNLYSVSSGGSTLWTETRDYDGTDDRVRTVNGYMSVNLGSVTALPNIDWSQDLWLGMTVRGSAACAFATTCTPADSEMTPRTKLTAVPYALAAGNVRSANTTAGSTNSDGVNVTTGATSGATSNSGAIALQTGNATTSGNTGNITLQSGNATSGNSGNILLDSGTASGTAGTISIGTANTSGITIGRVGVTTTNGGNLVVGASAGSGVQFTNNGSTLNAALSVANDVNGGPLGGGLTAAQSVDIYTAFTVDQDTAGQDISLPNPTSSTAGRIVYVLNVGDSSFTMHSVTIPSGYGQLYIWNGSAWKLAASGGGAAITLQAAYDGGNTITSTNARNFSFTSADTATDANLIFNIATGSTGAFKVQSNGTDVMSIGSAGQLALPVQGITGGILLGGDSLAQLYRSAAGVITSTGTISTSGGGELRADGDLFARYGGAAKVSIGALGPSSEAGILFGSANDTNLYRSTTNTLRTDDSLILQGSLSAMRGNDYSTTGNLDNVDFGAVSLVRLTGGATQNVRGVAGGSDGRILTIVNAAAQSAYVYNDDSNSTAANRILTGTGGTLTVPAGSSIILIYDSGASRWRIVGGAAAASTGAGAPFVHGGNSFGEAALLGTNDNFALIFETNGVSKAQLTTAGDLEFLQASTIQTNSGALTVDSAAALNLGTVDATSVSISRTGVATTVNGSLNVVQDFSVNTSSFVVTASNGNTDIAGTLKVGTSDAFQVNASGNFQTTGTGYINTNSTTAFKVEQSGVNNNTLVVDTTNGRVGVKKLPTLDLDVSGDIGASSRLILNNSGNGALAKNTSIGTGGVNVNDVVVLANDGGVSKAVQTSTLRDARVYGVATFTYAAGVNGNIAVSGQFQVTADTGAVSIGDQLVTSATAGQATVDNNATIGILGIAMSSKSAGSSGLVSVMIRPVNGQSSPYYRTNDFRVQDTTGATNLLRIDGSTSQLAVGPAAVPANGVLTVGTNTTTASGGLYFGTDTNLYRGDNNTLKTDDSFVVQPAGGSAAALQVLDGTGGGVFNVISNTSVADVVLGGTNKTDSAIRFQRSGSTKYSIGSDSNALSGTDGLFIYNNNEGAYVAGFGDQGQAYFRNSTNTTTGFTVQNAASAYLLNVDTSTTSNLITNGDMEYALTGWTAKGTSTLSQSTAHQWQGNRSLSVATTTTSGDGANYSDNFTASTEYTLSLYAKVASGSITDINIGRQDNGSDIDCLTGQTVTANWTRFSCTFTTGGTISGSNVYIKKTGSSAETFFIDGVQLQIGASATAFDPGGKLQLSGIVNSPLTVRNKQDSATAFQIQNAAGTSNLFVADTTNSRIGLGVMPITTAGSGLLQVGASGSTTAAQGISFGGDTVANLYRSASGSLKTDGEFNATSYSCAQAGSANQTCIGLQGAATPGRGIFFGSSLNDGIYNPVGNLLETTDNFAIGGRLSVGTTSLVQRTTLNIYDPNESVTQTDFTQGLTKAGINLVTDETDDTYTPGLFWSAQNFAADKPRAGIYLFNDNDAGTSMLFGTSNNFATGITNTALTIGPTGDSIFSNDLAINGGDITTTAGTATLFNTNATTLNVGGAVGAGGINLAGGSGSTGCTVDGSNGNLTCSGNVTSTNTSGTVGFWSRNNGTSTLQPATSGDHITTTGNISTSGSGALSVAGTTTLTGITKIGNNTGTNTFGSQLYINQNYGTIASGSTIAGSSLVVTGNGDATGTGILYGTLNGAVVTGTNSLAQVFGSNSNVSIQSTGGTIAQAFGSDSVIANSSSQVVTSAIAVHAGITNSGSGSITSAYGLYADSPTVSAGSIGTAFGVVINPQKVSGVTNGVGIYQSGANDVNYFNGSVGLGVSSPSLSRLVLATDTTEAGGITFGTGVDRANLYRSAADTLKTDDSLVVGSIGSGGTNLLCYDGSNKLSTCSAAPGAGSYIYNGTTLQTSANFNIQSAAAGSIGGIIRGASSQTADLLQLQNSGGTALSGFKANGNLYLGDAGTVNVTLTSEANGSVDVLQLGEDGSGALREQHITSADQTGTGSAANLVMNPGASAGLNQSGAFLAIAGGLSTGNAAGGSIFFNTSNSGASGSGVNSFVNRWGIDGATGHFYPITDNTYDIGFSGFRVRNIYTGKLDIATTSSTTGSIDQNGARLIHTYGTSNFFAGANSGNVTQTGSGANVGVGANTLAANTTGNNNAALGANALVSNQAGNLNTAVGSGALGFNVGGTANTGVGGLSLYSNSSGNFNTALGYQAGYTSVAGNANTTGTNNTFIGYNAGPGTATQLQNATAIGYASIVSQDNSLILGCINGTNGCTARTRIGIGTDTPSALLHINALAAGTDPLFKITDNTATARDVLTIADGGATTFRNQTDSTAAFQIQNAAGTQTVLAADTTNQVLTVVSATTPSSTQGALNVSASVDKSAIIAKSTDGAATTEPIVVIQGDHTSDKALQTKISGDSFGRFNVSITGAMEWGSGSASRDTNLYRPTANTLQTDDAFIVGGTSSTNSAIALQVISSGGVSIFNVDTFNSKIGTRNESAASTNTAVLTIKSGDASGATSNSGNVVLDSGSATGTTGSISIGITNSTSISLGNTTAATATNIQGGTTGGVNIGTVGSATTGSTIHIADTSNATGVQTVVMGSTANTANYVRLQAGSATGANNGVQVRADGVNAFQIQNAAGSTTILKADITNTKITIGTTYASNTLSGRELEVGAAAVSSKIRIGTDTNGVSFNDSTTGAANKLRRYGTALETKTITLVPEFAGAVLTGDGSNNTGTMTSDFCGNASSGPFSGTGAINSTVCATGEYHNYYSWTAQATNDYNIYVKYRLPDDFTGFGSDNSIKMYGWRPNSSTETATLAAYKNGTQCGSSTNVATYAGTGSQWTETNLGGSGETGCGFVAGDTILFVITVSVGTNNNFVRAGEITFDYLSNF